MSVENSNVYFYNGESVSYVYVDDIPLSKKQLFVNSVCDVVISGKNYRSLLRDLFFDYFVVKYFSDIDLSLIEESPNFIQDVDDFLKITFVADVIKIGMADDVLDQLNQAVDDNITYITGINHNSIYPSLNKLIKTITDKINDIDLNSLNEFIPIIANAVDNGEFNMESLMSAYQKSDAFKDIRKNADERHDKNMKIIEEIAPTVESMAETKRKMNEVKNIIQNKENVENIKK